MALLAVIHVPAGHIAIVHTHSERWWRCLPTGYHLLLPPWRLADDARGRPLTVPVKNWSVTQRLPLITADAFSGELVTNTQLDYDPGGMEPHHLYKTRQDWPRLQETGPAWLGGGLGALYGESMRTCQRIAFDHDNGSSAAPGIYLQPSGSQPFVLGGPAWRAFEAGLDRLADNGPAGARLLPKFGWRVKVGPKVTGFVPGPDSVRVLQGMAERNLARLATETAQHRAIADTARMRAQLQALLTFAAADAPHILTAFAVALARAQDTRITLEGLGLHLPTPPPFPDFTE